MKKRVVILTLLTLTAVIIITTIRCSSSKQTSAMLADSVITPVNLPSIVPGFSFPQDTPTVYKWISPKYDSTAVYNHAWGIWAGLTAESGETYQGDSLLVYQTWLGIGEIQSIVQNGPTSQLRLTKKTSRTLLTIPNQFKHAQKAGKLRGMKALDDTIPEFWVAVSYNPQAASHVVNNQMLKQSVLNKYFVSGGIGSIPPFPDTAITTKPVYYVGHKGDQLIRIPAWPGQPTVPQAFGETSWNSYVYADVHNAQTPGKKLVPVTSANPTPDQMKAATCNLSDFISFKMDTVMAAYINQQQGPVQGVTAATGDIAILVAMHVTTREIHNWTWQTYYWAVDPDAPLLPSSNLAAKLRPAQLHGAAKHYAAVTAYAEVLPNQPINGGSNKGVTPVIGYNPYLEAVFGPGVFTVPNAMNSKFQYGIQTNCMSCHAFAAMNQPANPNYSTDQYISMNNKIFVNNVQLDFSWSMQAAIIPDVPPDTGSTTKAKAKAKKK